MKPRNYEKFPLGQFTCANAEMCGNKNAEWKRQSTMYPREESNWVCLCKECFEEIEEYWKERWDEINADRYESVQAALHDKNTRYRTL